MNPVVLNVVVLLVALSLLYGVWMGVHLLARKLLGERKLGCKGPSVDEEGNQICCTTGELCKNQGGESGHAHRSMGAG